MINIFKDISAAAKTFGAIHKARKAGADAVRIKPVYIVPSVTLAPAYPNTIEGCQSWKLGRDVDRAVMNVFMRQPYEVQRQLEFTPKEPGGWVERARFWQKELKPALPPKMYHNVMVLFIHWYAHCLRREKMKAKEEARG